MRKSSKFAALALSAALALGIATPAFAVTEATVEDGVVTDAITKVLKTNDGSTVSEDFAFTATATQVDVAETGKSAPVDECPAITLDKISYKDGGKKDGDEKKIDIDLSRLTFPHAGVYAYELAETKGTTEGMTYDTQKYTMRVYVVNGENGLEVSNVTIENEKEEKVATAEFDNSYVEKAADLVISKATTGASANKTKQFSFKVTFTDPTVVPGEFTITGTKGNETIAVNNGVATFTLCDGESATFTGLQAGTTYTIEETELAGTGYTPSGTATENGNKGAKVSGTKDTDFKDADKLAGENENKYEMENEASDITVTGLFLNNAPFILMGAVAVAGVVLYGAAKRKLVA